jgi:hypothetical protein
MVSAPAWAQHACALVRAASHNVHVDILSRSPLAGPSRLASKVFTITEAWDVAAFLGRQFGAHWRWTSGVNVPHLMNKASLLLEATLLVVMFTTAWGRIAPASPANVLLSCTFALHYGCTVASGVATPAGLKLRMVGRLLTNRILVPFFVTIYSFAISRFGVLPA